MTSAHSAAAIFTDLRGASGAGTVAASEGGDARLSSGADAGDRQSPAAPADRALRECEKTRTGRCIVYAVDDRVVWRPEPTTR